jgi:glyoxylase-like metal-dependent hydrolase (beta-lactamase superfamily II)
MSFSSYYSPLKALTYFVSLIFSCFIFNTQATVTWHTVTPHIQFLQQSVHAKYYDANQVLLEGEHCALLFDVSGNFAQAEHLAKTLKTRLKTPLCYLVSSHADGDHLLGMAVMQTFFPNAKLVVHHNVNKKFKFYQSALTNKLSAYKKSIELSYQRLSNLPQAQQPQWQEKLTLAKARLFRWQTYSLKAPQLVITDITKLNLGNFNISIHPHVAHTDSNLTIMTNNNRILLGGDIVDWLPYPGQGHFDQWQSLLLHYINHPQLETIIPGHGEIVTPSQLKQPWLFLKTINELVSKNSNKKREGLKSTLPTDIMSPYQQDALDKKTSQLFLDAGIQRVLNAK